MLYINIEGLTMILEILKDLCSDDFQNRGGMYPKPNIPVSIHSYDDTLDLSFKSTSEDDALEFTKKFCKEYVPYRISFMDSCQDGDYNNDWVNVYVKFSQ